MCKTVFRVILDAGENIMIETAGAPRSSIASLKSTIAFNRPTSRWFAYLLTRPKAKDELKSNSGSRNVLSWAVLCRFLCASGCLALLLSFLLTKNPAWWPALLALAAAYFGFGRLAARNLSSLGMVLIRKHFSVEDIEHMTLFQIAESLASRYNARSFAASMVSADHILRATLVLALVTGIFFFPLNFFPLIGFAVAAYWTVSIILDLPVLYGKLS